MKREPKYDWRWNVSDKQLDLTAELIEDELNRALPMHPAIDGAKVLMSKDHSTLEIWISSVADVRNSGKKIREEFTELLREWVRNHYPHVEIPVTVGVICKGEKHLLCKD